MKDIVDRVSYLQGLSEGLNITEGSPQGKIISGILNILDEIALSLALMQEEWEEFKEYVESIDDDLFELEETLLFDGDIDDEDDRIEVECVNCGEELYFDADILEDDDVIEIVCPRCNHVVYINDGCFDHHHAYIDDDIEDDHQIENPSPS